MIATHPWVKTRFIASLQMVYLSHSFFKLVLRKKPLKLSFLRVAPVASPKGDAARTSRGTARAHWLLCVWSGSLRQAASLREAAPMRLRSSMTRA